MRVPVARSEVSLHGYSLKPESEPVGNHIAELLKVRGYTFKTAADKIGMSRQALDSYVNGRLQPTIEVALKLSKLLKVDVEEVFYLEEGAWYTTAKDENGHTIFHDGLTNYLLSGDPMKGTSKTKRFNVRTGEVLTASEYKKIEKREEDKAVEQALARDGSETHNRDTLAEVKKQVRQKLEQEYPLRYETMYRKIEEL